MPDMASVGLPNIEYSVPGLASFFDAMSVVEKLPRVQAVCDCTTEGSNAEVRQVFAWYEVCKLFYDRHGVKKRWQTWHWSIRSKNDAMSGIVF